MFEIAHQVTELQRQVSSICSLRGMWVRWYGREEASLQLPADFRNYASFTEVRSYLSQVFDCNIERSHNCDRFHPNSVCVINHACKKSKHQKQKAQL